MRFVVLVLLLLLAVPPARADVPRYLLPGAPLGVPTLPPGAQCRLAVQNAGHAAAIPDHLMSAIARVESGRPDLAGVVQPWPWSINVEGVDHVYDSKAEAIAAVRAFQARGIRSIDVGCMQVNLMYHPDAFASLDQAFDPMANAIYAAGFLRRLFAQTGSWPTATAAYHSAAPELGMPYQRKVQAVFAEEQRQDEMGGTMQAMNALPAGQGAIMLGNRAQAARLLPMAAGTPQRGLDSYRARPVPIAAGRGAGGVR
jgi:hypothetical protein